MQMCTEATGRMLKTTGGDTTGSRCDKEGDGGSGKEE